MSFDAGPVLGTSGTLQATEGDLLRLGVGGLHNLPEGLKRLQAVTLWEVSEVGGLNKRTTWLGLGVSFLVFFLGKNQTTPG